MTYYISFNDFCLLNYFKGVFVVVVLLFYLVDIIY